MDVLLYSLGGPQWLHFKTALLTCLQHLEVSSNQNSIFQTIQSICMNFSGVATQYQ